MTNKSVKNLIDQSGENSISLLLLAENQGMTTSTVCDCHCWPTVQEMHEYVVALEQERNRLTTALLDLRMFSNDGGCWCAAFSRGHERHDIECQKARDVIASMSVKEEGKDE